MRLEPYLFFPGSTKNAMEYYAKIFGGELQITLRGDMDPSATEAEKSQVINALLQSDQITLRASDRGDTTLQPQNRVEITINGSNESRLVKTFDELAVDGTIESPLEKQFWGDTWGKVTDRFGITWQVNVEASKP